MMNQRLFIFGLMFSFVTGRLIADPLDQWTWRFPNPTGRTLAAVTYGGSQFVAVGDNGTIISSPDGYNWSNRVSGVSVFLHGVAYADGEYAVAGDGGTILVSTNLTSWTQMPAITTNTLLGIAGNSGWKSNNLPQFIAVGASGAAAVCASGTNWSAVSPGTTNTLYSATWGSTRFIIVGSSGTVILLTTTGFNTRPQIFVGTTNDIYTVASSGNGVVAAAGKIFTDPTTYPAQNTNKILYSLNTGSSWKSQGWTVDQNGSNPSLWYLSEYFILTGMAYGSNGFVAVGYTGYGLEYHPAVVFTSMTGTNWTEQPPSISENYLNGVAYGNGLYVAVGDFGEIVLSTNAVNWTGLNPNRRGAITALACNSNLCIAAASPGGYSYHYWGFPSLEILVSTNGKNWIATETQATLSRIDDIDCSGSIFAGVSFGSVYVTTNGYDWQNIGGFPSSFHGIRFLNGQFFAVGDNGSIFSSADGIDWTNHSVSTTGSFNHLAYGNGVYVAGGSVTATSPDGINWTLSTSNPPAAITRMTFGKGVFVAVGNDPGAYGYFTSGPIMTSIDGNTWQSQYRTFVGFSGIAYNGGTFLASAQYDGYSFMSNDGTNWIQTGSKTFEPYGAYPVYVYYWRGLPGANSTVCPYKGTFLLGGMEDSLIQSGNLWNPTTLNPSPNASNGFSFSYNQQVDVPYRILSSTNLSKWETIYSGAGSGQPTNFTCVTTSNSPARFFRIVSP
jgi:hypothetical protein